MARTSTRQTLAPLKIIDSLRNGVSRRASEGHGTNERTSGRGAECSGARRGQLCSHRAANALSSPRARLALSSRARWMPPLRTGRRAGSIPSRESPVTPPRGMRPRSISPVFRSRKYFRRQMSLAASGACARVRSSGGWASIIQRRKWATDSLEILLGSERAVPFLRERD